MTHDPDVERQKARHAVADAERELAVARRAAILVEGAIQTGRMCVAVPGRGRFDYDAQWPYIFSQAWSLAERSVP